MRKLASAALASLVVAGGAMAFAGAAQSQPYGYYTGPGQYGYNYNPPRAYDRYGRYVPSTPYPNGYNGYSGYNNGYYSNNDTLGGIAGAVLGSVLGNGYSQPYGYGSGYGYGGGYGNVPVDQYGPDPNGMIGPDGRRIKCKLRRTNDGYYGNVVRRECWPT